MYSAKEHAGLPTYHKATAGQVKRMVRSRNLVLLLCILLASGTGLRAQEKADQGRKVSFTLQFVITPESDTQQTVLTFLVPANLEGRQKVVQLKYSRRPTSEFSQGGNHYARFLLNNPRTPIKIRMDAELVLYRYDLATAARAQRATPVPRPDVRKYLANEKFLEKNAPAVRQAAERITGDSELETLRNIMAYVKKTLQYSGWNKEDYGALGALRRKEGDCTEFSDLFVALSRAKNIPARRWEGYLTTRVKTADTAQHNWVEVFTHAYGWVPLDPLHFAQGSATFESLRPTRIYLSSVRNDPVLHNNYIYYYQYWGGPVTVKQTYAVHTQAEVPVKN